MAFDRYGCVAGGSQIAPGRDVSQVSNPGYPGRPRKYQAAILGQSPTSNALPSAGGSLAIDPSQASIIPGIAGGGGFDTRTGQFQTTQPAAPPIEAGPTAQKPDYSSYKNTLGDYAGRLRGYDLTKLNDLSYHDPKYDSARVQSHFDPSKGVGQDGFLDAMNAAGLGNFSIHKKGNGQQSEDYLDLANGVPKWDGMTGADVIYDSGSPNAAWTMQGDGPGWNQPQASPLQSAILGGAQPTAVDDPNNPNSADALRKQILNALAVDPRLMAFAKTTGF